MPAKVAEIRHLVRVADGRSVLARIVNRGVIGSASTRAIFGVFCGWRNSRTPQDCDGAYLAPHTNGQGIEANSDQSELGVMA